MQVHNKCHRITMLVHIAKLVAHHHLLCLDFHFVHHIQCIHHTIRHIHRQGKFKHTSKKNIEKNLEHFFQMRLEKSTCKHFNPIEIGMQLTSIHTGDLKC